MKLVAPGFHVVRAIRHASASVAFAAMLAVALAPVAAAAGAGPDRNMPMPEAMEGPTSAAANYSLGATTVRVRDEQRLFLFSGTSASVASQRTVDFGLGSVFSSAGDVAKIGDRYYIQITSGAYDGWWVAAPPTSPSSVRRYATPLTLKVAARDYYGVRFYDGGDVRSRLAVTVEAETKYHADRKGTFAGRTFYRMTDGPLAGRWVSARAVSVVTADAPVSPPTVDPVASWRGLVLFYSETDVSYRRSDGSMYRFQATMSNSTRDLLLDTVDRFRGSVRSWSGGLVTLDLDIVHVPHPVRALDSFGTGYWVGPSSVRDDIDTYAPNGKYDSIFVIWQAKDSSGEMVPVGGWGLSLPPGSWANGAGYSSIYAPPWNWWLTDSAAPEEIFVHEWMHQVIFFQESQGRATIDLHAAREYGYEPVNDTWKRWLQDVMQGKVWDGRKYIGVTPEMWAAGTPRNP